LYIFVSFSLFSFKIISFQVNYLLKFEKMAAILLRSQIIHRYRNPKLQLLHRGPMLSGAPLIAPRLAYASLLEMVLGHRRKRTTNHLESIVNKIS
jgi:hypothetical protein